MESSTPILIVGAGPTGLALALWLRKSGIPFRLIDKAPEAGETSRAIAVQARTLEFYRQLGLDGEITRAGITVRELVFRRAANAVATAKLGAIGESISRFAYLLFLPQDVHEKIVGGVLEDLGVEIERATELIHVEQDETGARAVISGPRGTETLHCQYVCGCDGAHSPVRHDTDIDFPGGTYSQVFFVADVMAQGDHSKLEISVSRGDFCIIMPVRQQGSVRLTGLVPAEREQQKNIAFQDVETSLRENTGLRIDKVNWFSAYRVHHRVATRFRRGRIFLLGDAAHIHSPAGGQGMNTGIGDAVNLAWKLAAVLQGKAAPKLLDTYEQERRAFAEVLVRTTDTAFRVIASRSLIGSLWRAWIMPGAVAFLTRFRPFLKLAFRTVSQTRIHYRFSDLSRGAAGQVRAGDRLPWVRGESADNHEPLNSRRWQVHVYGEADPAFRSAVERAGFELRAFAWQDAFEAAGFAEKAFYFIRPDGHVALAGPSQRIEDLARYLDQWSLRP